MKGSWSAAVAVWVLSALAGGLIVAVAPAPQRAGLLALALAGAVVLAFCIQLVLGARKGFTTRLIVASTGALLVLAIASLAGLAVP